MLGALLLVALQLLGQPQVLFVAAAARPRAGDRMRLDARAFDAHQHLRRRADDRHAAHADEIHVRRRVHVPQRAVDRERIGGDVRLEPLRQHDLVDVAGRDVLLRRPHLLLEPLARDVRPHVERRGRPAPVRCERLRSSSALEELDLRARELVQRLEVVVRRDARVGDDQDPVLHVIEGQHRVEQHEPGIVGAVGRRARGRRGTGSNQRRGAVAEVADRAAGEPRQSGHERRAEVGHQPPQRRRRTARSLSVVTPPRSMVVRAVAGAQDQERILAEERVAADVLAALDALEQERVVGVLGDLQKRRDRRQQVGDDLLAHRHERAAARQFLELLERRHVSYA